MHFQHPFVIKQIEEMRPVNWKVALADGFSSTAKEPTESVLGAADL